MHKQTNDRDDVKDHSDDCNNNVILALRMMLFCFVAPDFIEWSLRAHICVYVAACTTGTHIIVRIYRSVFVLSVVVVAAVVILVYVPLYY